MSAPAPDLVSLEGLSLEESEDREFTKEEKLALMAHQVKALEWFKAREAKECHGIRGGILGAKMGLGKTVIGLTVAVDGFTLVVVPKPLMHVWRRHLADWFPERKGLFFHKEFIGDKAFKNLSYSDLKEYDIVVTTYDIITSADRKYKASEAVCVFGTGMMEGKVIEVLCRKRISKENTEARGDALLHSVNWDRILLDEGHRINNHATKGFTACMALASEKRSILTGTPVRNRDTDLWSLLRFCGMNKVSSASKWSDALYRELGLQQVVLIMDYSDAKIELPPLHHHTLPFTLDEKERKAYKIVHDNAVRAYNDTYLGGTKYMELLASFTRLRQMCIASHLITPESKRGYKSSEQEDPTAYQELNQMTEGLEEWIHDRWGSAGISSSKIRKIVETVQGIPLEEKIVIGSVFTTALDLISEALMEAFGTKEDGELKMPFGVIQVDGKTLKRDQVIEQFKNDPNCRILLTSYKVGSEGHQFVVANHVFITEQWWNNSVTDQLASRAHRMGQTKECHVYWFPAENTIETKMVDLICKEKRLVEQRLLYGANISEGKSKGTIDRFTMGKILGVA